MTKAPLTEAQLAQLVSPIVAGRVTAESLGGYIPMHPLPRTPVIVSILNLSLCFSFD